MNKDLSAQLIHKDTENLTNSDLAIELGKFDNRLKTYQSRYIKNNNDTLSSPGFTISSSVPATLTPKAPVVDSDRDIQMIAGRFKRGPLTDEERKRRIDQNLCLYCGGQIHKAYEYPKKPKTRVASVATLPFGTKSELTTNTST